MQNLVVVCHTVCTYREGHKNGDSGTCPFEMGMWLTPRDTPPGVIVLNLGVIRRTVRAYLERDPP